MESDSHGVDAADGGEKPALLLIDVINDLQFPEGPAMLPRALRMAETVSLLKARMATAGCPVIYVNDNFGHWQSDFRRTIEHCLHDGVIGRPVVEKLLPAPEDYFILKPMHSGFYATSLELLLRHLKIRALVIAGIAGNNCVLFTANDAYMRGFQILVPADCVVSNTDDENRAALAQMRTVLKADTRPSTDLPFQR